MSLLRTVPVFSTAPPIGERASRVLAIVAEDDYREDLRDALTKEGYEVICVGDAEEVFRLAAEFEPDLIIVGIELPGTSGFELCGELRAGDLQHQTPVVLTGLGSLNEEIVARGLLAGADDFLDPTRMIELRARLRVQLRNKRYRDALARLRNERDSLKRDLSLDPLTGVLNRRSLEQAMRSLIDTGERFAVLFSDIDHFKSVNDNFGHEAGDQVLIAFADMLQQGIRPGDCVGRYGGEEFVILVAGAGPESARLVAERHRAAIERLDVRAAGPERITMSIGVAIYEPDLGNESPEELLRRADAALYEAKRSGRNRVIMRTRSKAPPGNRPQSDVSTGRISEPNSSSDAPYGSVVTGRAPQ